MGWRELMVEKCIQVGGLTVVLRDPGRGVPVHGCTAGSVVNTAPSESVRGNEARRDKKATVREGFR